MATFLRAGTAGLAVLCLGAAPLAAQTSDGGLFGGQPYTGGVLPTFGNGTNVENLRPQLERYFNTATLPAVAPTWVFDASLGVDVGVTDNALRLAAPRRADFFTVISPTLSATGDTARFKTNLSYSPLVQVYATQGSQTRVSQYFNGRSLAIVVPDAVFVDVRGDVTQSSQLGSGFNDGPSANYNRQNQVQTTSFSVTPYAEHRFGGWGTARVGYSFARSLQDSDDRFNTVNLVGTNRGYGSIGNLTTQRERASFATGENFGRVNDLTVAEAIQYSGTGSYSDAHRNQIFSQLGYALTRKVTLLGGLGYQDIVYSGSRTGGVRDDGIRINEPTWNTGVRYTPNADSTITVLYGRRDGSANVSFEGQFAPTARTRVIGRYSTGITSDLEGAQDVLATTSVGPGGFVTDTVTGAPVGTGGGGFGVQNGVYRVKRLSLTGLLLAARDSYSVTLTQEDRTTLSTSVSPFTGAVIPNGTSGTSLYVSGSWSHELAPDMTSNVSVQYGTTNNTSQFLGTAGNGGRQDTVSFSAALSKQFTATLSGTVRYTFTDQFGARGNTLSRYNAGNYTENILLVGLRKGF